MKTTKTTKTTTKTTRVAPLSPASWRREAISERDIAREDAQRSARIALARERDIAREEARVRANTQHDIATCRDARRAARSPRATWRDDVERLIRVTDRAERLAGPERTDSARSRRARRLREICLAKLEVMKHTGLRREVPRDLWMAAALRWSVWATEERLAYQRRLKADMDAWRPLRW